MWPPRGSSLELIYLGNGLEAAALVLGPDRVRGGEDGGVCVRVRGGPFIKDTK